MKNLVLANEVFSMKRTCGARKMKQSFDGFHPAKSRKECLQNTEENGVRFALCEFP